MRHVKELFGDRIVICEVDALPDDYSAHRNFRAAALQAGHPIHSVTEVTLATERSTTETEARQLAPALAQWITGQGVNVIVSPEQLSTQPEHRIVGRAIMLAAMRAAASSEQAISVLAAHGAVGRQGLWHVDATPETTLPATSSTSYTHHRIHPGMTSSRSLEAWVAGQ